MAAITKQKAIAYCLDTLDTSSKGVIITKSNYGFDCSAYESVKKFVITSSQPAGTNIYIAFQNQGSTSWYRLNSSGNAVEFTTTPPDYEILSEHGNTVAELKALTSIPAFTKKKVRVAVGLSSTDIKNAVPKIKLGLTASTTNQILNMSELSPVYESEDTATLTEISYTPSLSGTGSVKLTAQLTFADGTKTEWLDVAKAKGRECKAVQLKADYSVKDTSSSASISNAFISFTTGSTQTESSDGNNSGIITITQDWYMNVNHCRLNIRHNPLTDSSIEAYVSFRQKPTVIQNEQLGIGGGKKVTYQLKHKNNVKYDTVRLYYDNALIYSDYEFNSEVGRITCTPPEGVIVTCSYESDWAKESWEKMTRTELYSLVDYDVSEFRYSRPESDEGEKSVCAIKIVLNTKTGKAAKESVGKGTGLTQTYRLSHRVKDGNITVYDNGTAMSAKKYTLSSDPQYVRIAAASGHALTATYNWVSETPVVYQFISVFAE